MRVKLYSSGAVGTVIEDGPVQYKVRFDKPQNGQWSAFWQKAHCIPQTANLPRVREALARGPWNLPRKIVPEGREERCRIQRARAAAPRSWQYVARPTKQGVA